MNQLNNLLDSADVKAFMWEIRKIVKKKYTIKQLSHKTGCSVSQLNRALSSSNPDPKLDVLFKIMEAVDIAFQVSK